jgi:hypothetical protein
MHWVKSYGGPLIGIPRALHLKWRGTDRDPNANSSDYDRACAQKNYLSTIAVADGQALIFGDMPMVTEVVSLDSGPVVVRVMYCEPDCDVEEKLASVINAVVDNAEEVLDFRSDETDFLIFDSAARGADLDQLKEFYTTIEMNLPAGAYRIFTKFVEPDAKTGLVVHCFRQMA